MMQPGTLFHSQIYRAVRRVALPGVFILTLTVASSGQTPGTGSPSRKGTEHWRKYVNEEYGISFRYPRNYAPEEGPGSADATLVESQKELTAAQPGAILIASITVPHDVYPNTTLVNGDLQSVVNPVVTADTCKSFVAPADEAYSSGKIRIQETQFYWRQRGWAAGGTGTLKREYAGFSNGVCFEFLLEVATGSNPDADSRIKDANPKRIMGVFVKIVSSIHIRREREPGDKEVLPIIRAFTVEPFFVPHLQNVVRVSWEISGAREREVFLRVNCPGLADLNPLPDIDSSSPEPSPDPYSRPAYWKLESIFSCGSFAPIPPRSGSFRLQVENHSGEPVTYTLFVFHLGYITRP